MSEAGNGELAPLTVVIGSEELLVTRAVRRVVGAVRDRDPQAEVTDVELGATGERLQMLLDSPGLFAAPRALVLRGLQDADDGQREALLAYCADPLPDLVVVAIQAPGAKARTLPDQLAAAGARLVRCSPPARPSERLDFVQDEIRAAGGQATAGAVRALVEAVGGDLRELAAAAAQLVADTAGLLDEEAVARFHRGRAETTGFAVADAAIGGQSATAVGLLRSALATGTAPVLISSALASGLRDVARVRGVRAAPQALARELGMPPWKVDKTLRLANGWSDEGLSTALDAVAIADAGVKGAAADPGYALQAAVLTIVAARHTSQPASGRR